MAALSEWLQVMLGEIARKREDLERARDEEVKRSAEKVGDVAAPHTGAVPPPGEARSEAAPRNLTTS